MSLAKYVLGLMFIGFYGSISLMAMIPDQLNVSADRSMQAFFNAVHAGNIAEIQRQLHAGADVNAVNHYGLTALMLAVVTNHLEIVKLLLAAGANVNAVDHDGMTALMFANNPEQRQLLLAAGADVNAVNHHARSALMFEYNPEQTQLLLAAGANVNVVDHYAQDSLWRNPALWAGVTVTGAVATSLMYQQYAQNQREHNPPQQNDEDLLNAVDTDNLQEIRRQLHVGANVNAIDAHDKLALTKAQNPQPPQLLLTKYIGQEFFSWYLYCCSVSQSQTFRIVRSRYINNLFFH